MHCVAIGDLVIAAPLEKRCGRPLVVLWWDRCISVEAGCRRFAAGPLHGWVTAQVAAGLALRAFRHKKRKVSNSLVFTHSWFPVLLIFGCVTMFCCL